MNGAVVLSGRPPQISRGTCLTIGQGPSGFSSPSGQPITQSVFGGCHNQGVKVESPKSPHPHAPPPPPKEDAFWQEFGHDVREILINADSHKLQDVSNVVKNLGLGLRAVWNGVRTIPNHGAVREKIDPTTLDRWLEISDQVGLIAGLVAAGGQAAVGCNKLVSGLRHRHTGRKLDGLVDLATATTLALTVAGLGTARLIAAPLAASVNVLRGSYNAVAGFKQNDERKQLQGMLDATRSLGSLGRIFRDRHILCKTVGIALAPVAGAFQAGRGLHDVSVGIKNQDHKRMVRGLVDMATAVGTTMAFASGVAVIPGVVLAVAANGAKGAYQISPRFRGLVDRRLDRWEPALKRVVDKVDGWTGPLRRGWKKVLAKWIKHVDTVSPERFSEAQLSDITRLLYEDGCYSREERDRLRTTLEEAGQGAQTPQLNGVPPESQREQLITELVSSAERKNFVGFMLAVADYEDGVGPEEETYLRQLSSDLKVPEADFDQMLHDQLSLRQ